VVLGLRKNEQKRWVFKISKNLETCHIG
jgi:hypothetical protein